MSAISSGKRELLNLSITTALGATATTAVDIGHNVDTLLLQCNFTYVASAATSAKAYVQTSIDGGVTWCDIMCFAHTTASANRIANLSSKTALTTPFAMTDGTLADSTGKDGLIGNLIRVKYVTVGTYGAGTTMKIYMVPKHNNKPI